MRRKTDCISWGTVAIATMFATVAVADVASLDPVATALAKVEKRQQMLELPVRVVDMDGKPVASAKVVPWALRSSQGHGWWSEKDEEAGVGPKEVVTDKDGNATVLYPKYRDVREQIRTLSVSLHVDHVDFAYIDALHIDVPLETKGPYEIKLAAGVSLEIRPLLDNKPTDLANVFALWSDGRSWQPGASPEKTANGTLRFRAMQPGKNSVLLVKLDGDRATHFSKITDVELKAGELKTLDVPLRPSLHVQGILSDSVPRPVRRGRISSWTLCPARSDGPRRVRWVSWAPTQPDGTFAVDWPADERLQLIALCDGYIATSGKAPDVVATPPDPKKDFFKRPQVFDPSHSPLIVEMTPLVTCDAKAVDDDNKPVAGVTVISGPNVGWWNEGSQIYCQPLVRGERLLRERNYMKAVDDAFPPPFQAKTDAHGTARLELPEGNQDLAVESDVYELPAFLGQRDVRIKLVPGVTADAVLRLEPRGTEKLGEWDKLAGVVFGCSTREGRRICATPGVQKKMDEFTKRFREAKDQRDPQLLSEAYLAVADAFTNVGDQDEAAKWRQKAAEQAAKAKSTVRSVSKVKE